MKTKSGAARLVTALVIAGWVLTVPALAQECPELVGRWPYGPAFAVAVSGDHAYFGSGMVLTVAEVSDPAAFLVVGEVTLHDVPMGVAVTGSYAYVANGSAGLRIIDVSTPASPIEVGFSETPGATNGVAVAGSYAYVAGG